MTAATTSDENNESPKFSLADNSVAATKGTFHNSVFVLIFASIISFSMLL